MRTSPLFLTLLVVIGLGLIAIPVWRLTSAAEVEAGVGSRSTVESGETDEVEVLVWVSHLPAVVTLSYADRPDDQSVFEFSADGEGQELVGELVVATSTGDIALDVQAEFPNGDDGAVEIGLLRDGEEKVSRLFRVTGFADERVRFEGASSGVDEAATE